MAVMDLYDVTVIGAGPAGLSAALYAARARLKTLVLDKMGPGGTIANVDFLENYPGFAQGITGPELGVAMQQQAEKFGAEFAFREVQGVRRGEDDLLLLATAEGDISSRTVIVATGSEPRKLGVPGEGEFTGRGVSYCATCDGAFYRDKRVVVVGGGDSAITEALFLTRFASRVIVVHRRDQLRATKVLQDRAFANDKIDFEWNAVVKSVLGEDKVERVLLGDVRDGTEREVACDGVFVYIGNDPNTAFLRGSGVDLDDRGYIPTDERMRSNIPGLWAAGDVRAKSLRQVVTAVADGAVAAVDAEEYISQRWGH